MKTVTEVTVFPAACRSIPGLAVASLSEPRLALPATSRQPMSRPVLPRLVMPALPSQVSPCRVLPYRDSPCQIQTYIRASADRLGLGGDLTARSGLRILTASIAVNTGASCESVP